MPSSEQHVDCESPETAAEMRELESSRESGWRGIRWLAELPGMIAILLVRLYQCLISPLLGQTCRFHPSCSQYFILAVRKYGLIRALWKGTGRICRCHPWNRGGYDPP